MEVPLIFRLDDGDLIGLLSRADSAQRQTGVLIVVGGPQYRVGSHRQFLLLARNLAARGTPVFRFDYRGMGDSSGNPRDFEAIDEDIRTAIDVFIEHTPGLHQVVIWGLCDAASAALMYGFRDHRVSGLVLLNPWARSTEGQARAYLKHYYLRRLTDRSFWSGLLRGRFNLFASLSSLSGVVSKATKGEGKATADSSRAFPDRMVDGWERFQGRILLILSGEDLTAAEFRDLTTRSPVWQKLLQRPSVTIRELPAANHTFSRQAWRDQVAEWTAEWLAG